MFKDALGEHSRLEEEYFLKKDKELIEKLKESERNKAELLARTSHYHKCGCCGRDMKETVHEDVNFLQCTSCESLHFTPQNMELLSQGKRLRNLMMEIEIRRNEARELEESA